MILKNSHQKSPSPVGRPPLRGDAATGQIQLRVTMERKNAYVRAARPGKLSEWIFRVLDAEVERYRDGDGVAKHPAKARDCLTRAAAAGSPTAQDELKELATK